jgi:hypothetical protein
MTTLTNFFKESDSTLGVFYPKHYIIATFLTFDKAKEAAQALRNSGFSDEEVLAVPAGVLLKFFEEFHANASLWSDVMTMLSRAFGTEQVFVDDDVERARAGEGFLAVYSPEATQAFHVRALLEPFEPRAMHWYEAGGIQALV